MGRNSTDAFLALGCNIRSAYGNHKRQHQNENGTFSTLIGIRSYDEISATALIADGLLHSINKGYLVGDEYREAGMRAFRATLDNLKEKDGKYYLENISAPTIPLQAFPKLCYLYTPRGSNFKYGVAAATFAAIEYDKMMREN